MPLHFKGLGALLLRGGRGGERKGYGKGIPYLQFSLLTTLSSCLYGAVTTAVQSRVKCCRAVWWTARDVDTTAGNKHGRDWFHGGRAGYARRVGGTELSAVSRFTMSSGVRVRLRVRLILVQRPIHVIDHGPVTVHAWSFREPGSAPSATDHFVWLWHVHGTVFLPASQH